MNKSGGGVTLVSSRETRRGISGIPLAIPLPKGQNNLNHYREAMIPVSNGEAQSEQSHIYSVSLIGHRHVILSNWPEISFSGRKVNKPKMVQNSSHPMKSHTCIQRSYGMCPLAKGLSADSLAFFP
jgi:hypothetical protein